MKKTFIKFRITNVKKAETTHISTTSEECALVILGWQRKDCTFEVLGTEEVEVGGNG